MIITTENKQQSTNVLEKLRIMSETVSDEQVLELFKDSAAQIYADNIRLTVKHRIDIKEIEKNGNDGLELLKKLSQSHEMKSFDNSEIEFLIKTGVGIDIPEWMKSPESIIQARKVSKLKKLKNSMNVCDSGTNEVIYDFRTLFDLDDSDPATLRFKESLENKRYYISVRNHLRNKNKYLYELISKLTENKLFLEKSIPIYFSMSSGNLSRFDDGNSFKIVELDLKVSDGTMNNLMSALNKQDSNPVEIIKKVISSGLKRKYLHLSKNKASFDGFIKGRFPFALVSDEEIQNNIRFKNLYDLKELRKSIPKLELERYDSIVDGLLGR